MRAMIFECSVPARGTLDELDAPDGVVTNLRMVGEMIAEVRAVDQHQAAGVFAARCSAGVRPSRIDGRDVAAYCLDCRGPVYAGARLAGDETVFYCAGPCGLVIGAHAFLAPSHA